MGAGEVRGKDDRKQNINHGALIVLPSRMSLTSCILSDAP